MIDLSPVAADVVVDMYKKLEQQILNEKYESIWQFVFNVKNNKRVEIFLATSIGPIPYVVGEELKSAGLVRNSIYPEEYLLTAKGVSLAEQLCNKDSLQSLLNEIDGRFFKIEAKKITSREKVALFSMVMVRCFSETCCIDARKDDSIKDYWFDIFLRAEKLLLDLGVIDKPSIDVENKGSDIEHPMSNIIRHADLDIKTKMIFKKTGRNQYYLDVSNKDKSLKINNLEYIVKLIFDIRMNYDMVDEISDFCNNSARIDTVYVDMDSDNFSSSLYDQAIYDSLIQCMFDGNRI